MPGPPNPILGSRLTTLKADLNRTVSVCDARTRELDFSTYPVDSDAWNRAFRNVRDSAQIAIGRIEKLESDIRAGGSDAPAAWHRYQRLHTEARDVCRSCVELMGGFALRDHMPVGGYLDQRICLFTEKLAARCTELTDPYLKPPSAIPTPEEALAETLTRVIRLRFPEWNVWTLPLVAYEYARVVLDDIPQLKQAVADEVDERVVDGADAKVTGQLVKTLMADVLGTYLMGPAYVCAAVHLRLDPVSHAGGEDGGDLERAETMFAAIRQLYGQTEPATLVEEHVEAYWQSACRAVDACTAAEAVRARADTFARGALRTVGRATYAEASFPEYTEDGEHWKRAMTLSEAWVSEFSAGPNKPPPKSFDLREVLNAAWRSRLLSPNATDDFARRALDACQSVLATGPDDQKGVGTRARETAVASKSAGVR